MDQPQIFSNINDKRNSFNSLNTIYLDIFTWNPNYHCICLPPWSNEMTKHLLETKQNHD